MYTLLFGGENLKLLLNHFVTSRLIKNAAMLHNTEEAGVVDPTKLSRCFIILRAVFIVLSSCELTPI